MSQPRDFVEQLLDFSFTDFITVKIIGIIYGVGIGVLSLLFVAAIFSGFSQGIVPGIGSLIVAVLTFFVSLILLRISLEFIVVTFRIAQNTSRTAENTKNLSN